MKIRLSATDVCALLMGLVGLTIFLLIWKGNKEVFENFFRPGGRPGLIDYVSALFWLQASIICWYRIATSSQKGKLLLYFWAVFCFLCCNEEISWGQYLFGYSIPAVQKLSSQNELKLHTLYNWGQLGLLEAIKSGNWKWSSINLMAFLNPQKLFYLGFVIYFLIMPLMVHLRRFKALVGRFHYNPPSFYYLISIWSNIIFCAMLAKITDRGFFITETGEMFIAFAVLFYVSFYLFAESQDNPSKIEA